MTKYQSLLWLLAGCSCLSEPVSSEAHTPLVKIRNGTISGLIMKTRRGREFAGFRGIPYALPPLEELRFESPKPSAAWDGVRPAKEDANMCVQRNVFIYDDNILGVEDCLYLNVYTPKLPTEEDKSKGGYPVLIWLHGGGWIAGSGHSAIYGPKFLLDHDVILVTVNYRLGPLGFLSMEDSILPGNNGLKDQAQAIRWVHENIAAFGGDPNRVTIFGESAGGASVHLHMMSSLTRGLFHRAISQSGSSNCPWAIARSGSAKINAIKLADLLHCPSKDTNQLVACLRKKNANDIIGTDRAFQEFDYGPIIPFRPVVEADHPGAFLTEDPAFSSKNGRLMDIPWMTGITSEEGALVVPGLYTRQNGQLVKKLNNDFSNIAPMTLLFGESCPKDEIKRVASEIREFYFGKAPIDDAARFKLIDMYSDAWITHCAHHSVRDYLEKQSAPVYYYYLTYRGSASFSRVFGDPINDYGVCHGDEMQYLFPVGEVLFADTPLNEKDHKMVDTITSLWVNFASTGNPTPEVSKDIPIKWKPVRTEALEYLRIGGDQIEMSKNLIPERINFWNGLPIRPDLTKSGNQQQKDEL
ncbi:PREDICTED: esterase E4-like [Dufourea novaeangliae]|uniref:Carboxylic ester hydrolase n=1 Tax=Dufourea novaeangliae TaxID=178035 RepID=A0A154PTG2_DUFNO|nr:PREDICTED: esterase E4-like [Dufourea novaeangliae]KZC14638.1 Esterase FE4 [Dufourea novaeangliae]